MKLLDVKTTNQGHQLYIQEGCDLRMITLTDLQITYGSGGQCTILGMGRYAVEPPLSIEPVRQDAQTRLLRGGIFGRR